jgi:MFS family permease
MRQHERWAVSALFFTNGALFSSLLPRLPEVKASLDLSAGQLGLALLGIGMGGLVGSLATRWLLPRARSRWAAVGSTLVLAAGLPLIGLAPSAWILFAVLVGYGIADAITDVSMNVAGVEVQRRLNRSVLNSMHGMWSIAAVVGGLAGSAAAALDLSLPLHLGAVAAACVLVALLAARWVPSVTGSIEPAAASGPARSSGPLMLLCALAVVAALVEAAPYSWSAVYLAEHAGADPGTAGLGFTAFVTGMVVARLTADRLVERWGPVLVVRTGGLLGALALATALVDGGAATGIAAFAAMGVGSAAVFPAMITAAGALPGQAVQAMNMATRVGFLAAPPLVGLVADGVGLPTALALLVVPAALCLALFAGAVAVRR